LSDEVDLRGIRRVKRRKNCIVLSVV